MLRHSSAACLLFLFASLPGIEADTPTRTWTGTEGDTVEAEFVRTQDRYAILKTTEKTMRVPLRLLSETDQQWIDRYEELNRPRVWGRTGDEQVRGRFLDVRRGAARIKQGRDVQRIAVAELSVDDQAHIASVYSHLGKDLPDGISEQAGPSASGDSAAPDLSTMIEREWTDRTGRTIAAGFLGTRGPNVRMWRSDREFVYPIDRLSEADQEWIAAQNLQALAQDLQSGWRTATSLLGGPPRPQQPAPVTDLPPPNPQRRQPIEESRRPIR